MFCFLRWKRSGAFQLTAARRRLDKFVSIAQIIKSFQLTAARRRLAFSRLLVGEAGIVSTHSRPKAAGWCRRFMLRILK